MRVLMEDGIIQSCHNYSDIMHMIEHILTCEYIAKGDSVSFDGVDPREKKVFQKLFDLRKNVTDLEARVDSSN